MSSFFSNYHTVRLFLSGSNMSNTEKCLPLCLENALSNPHLAFGYMARVSCCLESYTNAEWFELVGCDGQEYYELNDEDKQEFDEHVKDARESARACLMDLYQNLGKVE